MSAGGEINYNDIVKMGEFISNHDKRKVSQQVILTWAQTHQNESELAAAAAANKANPADDFIDVAALQKAVEAPHLVFGGQTLEDKIDNIYPNQFNWKEIRITKEDRKLMSPLGMMAMNGAA